MRKSLRTYWFSLKTPLRDGRSATQPPPATPATTTVPKRAVRKISYVFIAFILSCACRSLSKAADDVGIEDRSVGNDGASEARVQAEPIPVRVERNEVGEVAVD